jgi:protein O-mannosyl-transferase
VPERPERPERPARWWQHVAAALALAVVSILAYWTALDAGFTLDADVIVRRAARVHEVAWGNVLEILTTDYWWPVNVMGLYRPLTTLSFLFEWAVLGHGEHAAGYHWANIALHTANALLVYAVGLRVLRLAAGTAFLAALLFATHPVATEVVANIAGRADLLATASVLAGLLVYADAVGSSRRGRRIAGLAGVAAIAAIGLLCKESAVVLVGAVVLYDLVFRLPGLAGLRPRDRLRALARAWVWLVVPLAGVGFLRALAFRRTPATALDFAQNVLAVVDPWTARLTALKLVGRAVAILVWPARLCPDYSVNEIPLFTWRLDGFGDWQALLALAGIGSALALAVALRRRAPAVAFSIGLFFVALVPTSNLLVPIGTVLAERFLYLPLVAFSSLLAIAVAAVARRGAALAFGRAPGAAPQETTRTDRAEGVARAVAWSLILGLAAAYGIRTSQRNLDWRTDVTLWQAATESCPGSYKSWQGLAAALAATATTAADDHTIDRVIELQGRAVGILEESAPPGAVVPAFVLERLGAYTFAKARAEARRSAAGNAAEPVDVATWARKAAAILERAVAGYDLETEERRRQNPSGDVPDLEIGTPRVHLDRGSALLMLGRGDEALAAFERARRLAPTSAATHLHVASAHAALGRDDEALVDTLQGLLVEPGRDDIKVQIYALYERVDPGGCAFTRDDSRVVVHPDCPAARRIVCRAYDELVAALATAPNFEPAARAEAIGRFRAGAERGFRCSELAGPDP